MPTPEYLALREKVDAFSRGVTQRRTAALRCRAGCSACCEVELEVCDVEADAVRGALRAMTAPERAALTRSLTEGAPGRCAMLDDQGRCRIYAARPLVCRTQGLPLRYPAGVVPEASVRARAGGDVTWCPLNFEHEPPGRDDVLDAERVDRMLALVNQRHADHPLRRTPLRRLAEDAVDQTG